MTLQIDSDNLSQLVATLGAEKCGSGYIARCPAHHDTRPSLSLSLGRNGEPLAHCHVGCSFSSIMAAARAKGYQPSDVHHHRPKQPSQLVCAYDYTNETGDILYRIARFHPKDFRPQHLSVEGKWVNGYGDARRVLYHLPEVVANETVFIVEGEKDVETLRNHGFVATTNAGGANGWRDEFNPVFEGKQVYIIPDNDQPGWERALRLARDLTSIARTIHILKLEGAKDITDWFAMGHSEVELMEMLEASHAQ